MRTLFDERTGRQSPELKRKELPARSAAIRVGRDPACSEAPAQEAEIAFTNARASLVRLLHAWGMQQPKRLPGEANPKPDADASMHVVRQSWMNANHGLGDGAPGIARASAALLAWRKRRKARRSR